MLYWLIPFLLLTALGASGFAMLGVFCARGDPDEGWEERRAERSGDEALRGAYRAQTAWLARRETEEIEVQSEDGFLLHALLVPHVAPRATVILFHGARSSWEWDFIGVLPFLYGQSLQLLLVDERAQGDSEGRWITYGVRERLDVRTWTEYAAERFGKEHPILLHGMAMGATAVLTAAGDRFDASVRGIVADSAFPSALEYLSGLWRDRTPFPARFAMWWLDRFTRQFADFSLNAPGAADALGRTEYPVLFLHGAADALVPPYLARQTFEACKSEKTLVLVDGAAHGRAFLADRARVEAAYREFVDKCLS